MSQYMIILISYTIPWAVTCIIHIYPAIGGEEGGAATPPIHLPKGCTVEVLEIYGISTCEERLKLKTAQAKKFWYPHVRVCSHICLTSTGVVLSTNSFLVPTDTGPSRECHTKSRSKLRIGTRDWTISHRRQACILQHTKVLFVKSASDYKFIHIIFKFSFRILKEMLTTSKVIKT